MQTFADTNIYPLALAPQFSLISMVVRIMCVHVIIILLALNVNIPKRVRIMWLHDLVYK